MLAITKLVRVPGAVRWLHGRTPQLLLKRLPAAGVHVYFPRLCVTRTPIDKSGIQMPVRHFNDGSHSKNGHKKVPDFMKSVVSPPPIAGKLLLMSELNTILMILVAIGAYLYFVPDWDDIRSKWALGKQRMRARLDALRRGERSRISSGEAVSEQQQQDGRHNAASPQPSGNSTAVPDAPSTAAAASSSPTGSPTGSTSTSTTSSRPAR